MPVKEENRDARHEHDRTSLGVGFPKKENDWGKGGKQLIFSEGFLVYVNDDDKVADWQILNTE